MVAGTSSVLDAERVRAQWQSVVCRRRNLKLLGLNPMLKVFSYDRHSPLPSPDVFRKFLTHVRPTIATNFEEARIRRVAKGMRHRSIHADRFGISFEDYESVEHLDLQIGMEKGGEDIGLRVHFAFKAPPSEARRPTLHHPPF